MSPIEYLENRVAALKLERPTSEAGREALHHTIHELLNCIWMLQLQAVHALHLAQIEAGLLKTGDVQ